MKTAKWMCLASLCWAPTLWAQETREAGPAWLGLKLGQVPEALASHLELEAEALLVLNVAAGSPADAAELDRFDVLVTYNGQPIPGDVREFASIVQAMAPGEKMECSLFRKGKRTEATIVLGARPRGKAIEYKYQENPDEIYEDHFDVMGKILRRRPDGAWALEDFWDVEHMPEGLQEFFEKHMPDVGDIDIERFGWGDWPARRHSIKRFDFDENKGIEIIQKRNGKITVRKFKSDGDVEKQIEEKTYANEEELKQNDQEAFDVYRSMTKGKGRLRGMPTWRFGGKVLDRDQWRERMSQMMDQAFSKVPARSEARGFTSFSVDEDGKIEVSIRRDDGEYKQIFKDADDLKSRKPELYKQLEEMRSDQTKPADQ